MRYFLIWFIGFLDIFLGLLLVVGPAPVTMFVFTVVWTGYILDTYKERKNKNNKDGEFSRNKTE